MARLGMYEIKFRKHKGGTIYKWYRYGTNIRQVRANTIGKLRAEFGNDIQGISIKRLTLAQEKKVQHG